MHASPGEPAGSLGSRPPQPARRDRSMTDLSRRGFIGAAGAITGAAAIGVSAPEAQAESADAAKHTPKPSKKPKPHGDLRDIKHVVVLMQENRSFDHYYGSLRGVRGFGDRSTITLP